MSDPRSLPHQIVPSDDDGDVLTTVGGESTWAPPSSFTETLPVSIMDAKGDLIVGSAADAAIRKAVGTDGQVLTADASASGGVKWALPAGGAGTPSFAQTGKTFTVARTTTSGSTWPFVSWLVSHYAYFQITSFTCDINSADTYTLSIDGEDVASAVCGAASSANVFTLTTPKVLTPGPHLFRLRGTANRAYYYSTTAKGAASSGTYTTKLVWGPWMEPDVIATPHGTLTFDAEGS